MKPKPKTKAKHGGARANSGGARKGAGAPRRGTVAWLVSVRPETRVMLEGLAKSHKCKTVGRFLDEVYGAGARTAEGIFWGRGGRLPEAED